MNLSDSCNRTAGNAMKAIADTAFKRCEGPGIPFLCAYCDAYFEAMPKPATAMAFPVPLPFLFSVFFQ